jgi:hypothetical protein
VPFHVDPGLAAALAAGAVLSVWQIGWGLPAAGHSWAVDSLEPATVLAIAKNSFSQWNSGWFYFKYPPAHAFTLAGAYAPYLGYLFLTGQWSSPQARPPHGFADPEAALLALSLIGRGVSVLFTLGTIAVAFGIGRRLFGIFGGRLAAWLVATSYPVVFYAHTMNVDSSYLFWLLAAVLAAIAASGSERRLPWALLGACAAMAVSTKEQAFGLLLPLPLVALWLRARDGGRPLWRQAAAMAVAAVAVAALANNALFNPLGVVARLAYLTGSPLTPVAAPLKPVAFSWWKGELEWTYLAQFWDGLDSALGPALAWLAVAGTLSIWIRPRAALWLLLPAAAYYYLALRGQQLITMRYALPALLLLVLVAAGFAAELRRATAGAARVAVTAAICLLALVSLARAVELDLLLAGDSRYQAEAWMRQELPAGARGEVYQKQTYLPRPQAHTQVALVPPAERSIAALETRRPDFLVLSSSSRKSISHVWNPDWRTTGDLLVALPEAERMLNALAAGELPYRRAAHFAQQPRLIRPRLTGLCPEITIWRRQP